MAKNTKMRAPIGRELSPVPCSVLLRLFPFGVVLNRDMCIQGVGGKLLQAWGGNSSILNKPVTEIFKLRRPKGITFTWGNVSLFFPLLFQNQKNRIFNIKIFKAWLKNSILILKNDFKSFALIIAIIVILIIKVIQIFKYTLLFFFPRVKIKR